MNSHVLSQVAPNLRALTQQHVIQNPLISLRQSHLPLCVWIRATHRDLDNQTADVTWMMRPWLRLLQFKRLHRGWRVGGPDCASILISGSQTVELAALFILSTAVTKIFVYLHSILHISTLKWQTCTLGVSLSLSADVLVLDNIPYLVKGNSW